MRMLYAYWIGKQNFFPLNGKAFKVLKNIGLYGRDSNIDEVRIDVEEKLSSEKGITLIDFHEMLCFLGQTGGKSVQKRTEIVIGWNASRLLCSNKRAGITQDWIQQHLVKDENVAKYLFN